MARRGSTKELSERHEQDIADVYGGQRSESSGGAVTDEGDVRVTGDHTLFECKGKFGRLAGKKEVTATILSQIEKIADEAHAINYQPALALRFYAPESPLSDPEGWVDLVVRLLEDDLQRFDALQTLRGRSCEGRWR